MERPRGEAPWRGPVERPRGEAPWRGPVERPRGEAPWRGPVERPRGEAPWRGPVERPRGEAPWRGPVERPRGEVDPSLTRPDAPVKGDRREVTSGVMCQGEWGVDPPRPVFVDQDRVEDAVRRCPVPEGSRGPCSSADLAEPSFAGIGGPDLPSPGKGPAAEAGERRRRRGCSARRRPPRPSGPR